ncbi:MAG: Protein of unknown function (DUF1416) [Rhodobacteraceae bacterium HLUCCA08]|nr:MAG: Protein of unknown function (DUF1416) [Rhodobacteraceae bacterium HLUCCA08]
MKRLALALILSAGAALAHQLTVFAFVEDGDVVVETRFSSGRVPVEGTVRVLDATEALVLETTLAEDGTARFPLDPGVASDGLTIVVETGEGHDNYWILTPQDIAGGRE